MIRGSRLSAQALYPRIRAQEVIANNLANAQNDGFRRERIAFHRELSAAQWPDQRLVGHHDDSGGGFTSTANPLDFAINGDGYFVVDTPVGEQLTRAGAFTLGPGGELMTAAGHAVQGDGGPIVLPPGEVSASPDGAIRVGDQIVATLRVVSAESEGLERTGENMFRMRDWVAPGPRPPATTVIQGSVESANVEPVIELVEMIRIHREYESNYKAMSVAGDSLSKLIDHALRG